MSSSDLSSPSLFLLLCFRCSCEELRFKRDKQVYLSSEKEQFYLHLTIYIRQDTSSLHDCSGGEYEETWEGRMGAREAHARGGGGKEQKRKRLQRKAAAATAVATPAAAVERGRWCESEESLRGLADDGHNDDETRGGGGGGGGGNLSFIPRFYYVYGTKSCGKGGVELLYFFPSFWTL